MCFPAPLRRAAPLCLLLSLLLGACRDAPLPEPEPGIEADDGLLDGMTGSGADLDTCCQLPDASMADMGMSEEMGPHPPDADMDVAPVEACRADASTLFVSASQGKAGASGTFEDPLDSINAALARATAGTTILVRQGTYTEQVRLDRSGTPEAPLVIAAYCGERPVLTGGESAEGLPSAVLIVDQAYITIAGFEIRDITAKRADDFPAGIWVRGASHHITLRDNLIHHVSAWRGGEQSGAHGLAIYGTSPAPLHDVLIAHNELHSLTLGWSEALVVNGNVHDFVVTDNSVHDVDNIAFDFIGFEQDVCPTCSQEDVIDATDVNRVRRGLIRNNLASQVSSKGNPAYGNDKSAGCYYVDGGANLIIERNVATRCDIGVELASEHFGKSTRNIVVRDNLLYELDVTAVATGGYDAGRGAGGGSAISCAVVHNTIVDASRDGWANTALLLQNRNVENRYQNNIIVATSGHAAMADFGSKNENNLFSHNLYLGTLDGIEAGEGSRALDPQLTDVARHDLRPREGSPAIDAGTPLPEATSGATDYAGAARPQGAAPDVGAYEVR